MLLRRTTGVQRVINREKKTNNIRVCLLFVNSNIKWSKTQYVYNELCYILFLKVEVV